MEFEQEIIFKGAPMAKGTDVKIVKMPLNKIKLNRNSRLDIDPDELDGLMQSIKEEGLLQPTGVVESKNGFEICYGNRRFLACSKLGMNSIPAIVHQRKKESDVDIKNLTENVQRRNLSLSEIGRYVTLLEKDGLTRAETAVRLGVTKGYVDSALEAFQNVPKEYRDSIEVKVSKGKFSTKAVPGKISMTVARKIINAEKSGYIRGAVANKLFKAAKTASDFQPSKIEDYIKAAAHGNSDFLEAIPDVKYMTVRFKITQKHHDKLTRGYVNDGPFKSLNELFLAILKGQKAVKIEILDR